MRASIFIAVSLAALAVAGSAATQQQNSTPTAAEMNAARSGPCSDPWVTIALQRYYVDNANPARCGVGLYNGGVWSNFQQLYAAVGARDRILKASQSDLRIIPIAGTNRRTVGIFSRLVAAGGGNLVAAGGGNLVAAGGGNLVSPGGGSLVAAGGGNLGPVSPGEVLIRDNQLVLASSVRSLMSAAEVKRVTVPVAIDSSALDAMLRR